MSGGQKRGQLVRDDLAVPKWTNSSSKGTVYARPCCAMRLSCRDEPRVGAVAVSLGLTRFCSAATTPQSAVQDALQTST